MDSNDEDNVEYVHEDNEDNNEDVNADNEDADVENEDVDADNEDADADNEDADNEDNEDVDNEDNDDEDNVIQEEFDEDEEDNMENSIECFKKTIKQYLELDEEIKILDKASKVRKDKKKKLSECILSFIQEKDISYVNLQGNYKGKQIQSKEVIKKSSVNLKSVSDIIFEHLEDKEQARALLEKL